MTATIDLANPARNGAWLVSAVDLDVLDAAAHAEGHSVRRISLAGCQEKTDLLQRIAGALAFPKTFGANWDALADCLGDLGWLPQAGGYVWLFDHAGDLRDVSEHDFDVLCDILDGACAGWRDRGTPCFAFLAMPDDAFPKRSAPTGKP
jgi:RNAse (barnase) inhibitor barstar